MGTVTALSRIPQTDNEWQDYARSYVHSALVPEHFRGNMANCIIAAKVALSMGENPLVTMQNMHVVKGKAGFSTSYMIARANRSGLLKGPIRWKVENRGKREFINIVDKGRGNVVKTRVECQDLVVTAWAKLAEDPDDPIEVAVSTEMAAAEGWLSNSKYLSMAEHMLRWRSAAFLIRLYMPEVMHGFQTSEELTDLSASRVLDVHAEARPADPLALAMQEMGEPDAEAELAERQERTEVAAELVDASEQHAVEDELDEDHPPDLPEGLDEARGWEQESASMKDDPSLL